MLPDFFKDLKALLMSKTLPNRQRIDRMLDAYNKGVLTLEEAVDELARWFEEVSYLDE